jgi:hypothetical protein
MKANIDAYFQKIFIPQHVLLVDHTYKIARTKYSVIFDGHWGRFSCYSQDGQVAHFAMGSRHRKFRELRLRVVLFLREKEKGGGGGGGGGRGGVGRTWALRTGFSRRQCEVGGR